MSATTLPPARIAFWRSRAMRWLLYQAVVLVLLLGAVVMIFRNTFANLQERGISSGFGFLANEAGFGIGETMAIPRFEGGFAYFMAALLVGLVCVFALHRYEAAQGRVLGNNPYLVTLTVGLIVVVPGLILYANAGSLVTDTYDESHSYALGLITGLGNTLKVSMLGCVLATLLGLFIGVSRLSSNWLVSRLAATYVEVVRNVPLLLQLFFWYHAVLRSLPSVRESITVSDVFVLNNRGVYLPDPATAGGFGALLLALLLAGLGCYYRARYARVVREATGRQLSVLYPAVGLLAGLPALAWLAAGSPLKLSYPVLEGFNYRGGLWLSPEYAAMLAGLTMYTAAFIAEIVRSGIQAVSKGQREAAMALGLRGRLAMRLVILPQALRVIIPPLTSQYLNLTKNSSLGVAIGFPELVSVGGTILNQSGQAIEIIAISMAVYLAFSLLISLFMNWYNASTQLVER